MADASLALLRPVLAAAALPSIDAQGIQRASDDVITDARQVAHTSAANQHDAVFLEVVFFARDVSSDFLAIAQPHAGDLAKGRVRLLRGHRLDLQANAALLRAGLKVLDLIDARQRTSRLLDQLIDCRHGVLIANCKRTLS